MKRFGRNGWLRDRDGMQAEGMKLKGKFSRHEERTHNVDAFMKCASQWLVKGRTRFRFGEVGTCCHLTALHLPTPAELQTPLSLMLFSLSQGPQDKVVVRLITLRQDLTLSS